MNTYGRTLAVTPDDNPNDNEILLGVYDNGVRVSKGKLHDAGPDDVRMGDQLVFFSPASGKVLGYAHVRARNGERVTLSEPVPGVVPWQGDNPQELTLVYSIDSVGNFVVRDSKFMDSMRVGIIVKARGGVIWGNTIEGTSAPGVFAANEPDWPEGPPPSHLWVQGNTFSQNNYSYMSRHRDHLFVDPADISVYTRRFRDPNVADNHLAFVTHGQATNNHVKLIGNTFHDWRGMGISVRTAKNVQIENNVFLPPVQDEMLRGTLNEDPASTADGTGRYAAIFLDSVDGGRIARNTAIGLPAGDALVARATGVTHLDETQNNKLDAMPAAEVSFSFSEWFGTTSASGVTLDGATHVAGRLGAGLWFDGKQARAEWKSTDGTNPTSSNALTVSLWVRTEAGGAKTQVIYTQGDVTSGLVIALDDGRLIAGVWQDGRGAWLDLGPAGDRVWTHVSLVCDGPTRELHGYVNGREVASAKSGVPSQFGSVASAVFGGASKSPVRIASDRQINAGGSSFRGTIDEFRLFRRAISAPEASILALRRPE
ncbi:MAG: right-handed parallel beta-helix repeat-containing protein [Tepidisphaeraceae bacterium]